MTLDSARAGARPATLTYLTPGLGWTADYVSLYDEAKGTVDVQGWVTLTNRTGTTFTNADTLLVAGTPQLVQQQRGGYRPSPPPPRAPVRNAGTETANARTARRFLSLSAQEPHDDRQCADQAGQLSRRAIGARAQGV